MCKDLEHYSEQDWNMLLDKPELVFARARFVHVCGKCVGGCMWCQPAYAAAALYALSSQSLHRITARRTSWSSAGTSAPATRWVDR